MSLSGKQLMVLVGAGLTKARHSSRKLIHQGGREVANEGH